LPKTEAGEKYLSLMKQSVELLKNHPINIERVKNGKNPANSIWFWGEGTKPRLDGFKEKFGVDGAMISAVDLLKGIAKLTGMENIEVDGATGNYDTNFIGKAESALSALKNGKDFVYIHMEAPDECGHQGNLEKKIYSIEQISEVVVKYLTEELDKENIEYSMLILPDHPTPIKVKTHVSDAVPYLLYRSNQNVIGTAKKYTEKDATNSGVYEPIGHELMKRFIKGN
jgi:2,3-bisphosphoglycerate-independent phosphoglycerate mutase